MSSFQRNLTKYTEFAFSHSKELILKFFKDQYSKESSLSRFYMSGSTCYLEITIDYLLLNNEIRLISTDKFLEWADKVMEKENGN